MLSASNTVAFFFRPFLCFRSHKRKDFFYVFLVFTETSLARLEICIEITELLKLTVLLFEQTQG